MALASPFYFAWVEPSETSFNGSHLRMDEYIFSAKRTIAEGEKPLLEIEIQNPHTGILSPGRKYWAWFSWFNGSSVVPIFFGRVVGVPVQIFEEVITLQLIADPIDYKQRIQQVAETLKYRPYYDQVFIDVGQRDDPNTILEAHAMVWDVNPVTHACTANPIITGPDGNVDFTEDDHFYDGMTMTVGQPPATAILMDASVSWKQTARGTVDLGQRIFNSYGGDGMISEWPKPLATLGGGWSVYYSDAYDTYKTAQATTQTITWSYTNKERTHHNGDTMSASGSETKALGKGLVFELTNEFQTGYISPGYGENPQPINIPATANATYAYVMEWSVVTSLVLQYVAERERTERVIFLVRAETQPVITQHELSQESEVMNKSGADVGIPIINLLNWTTIAGTFIDLDQIIFPDNPSIPGGRSVQIAVQAGTAGTVHPNFSDVPGFTTNDGSVVWSSLGQSTPPENAVDWTAISNVNAGSVILPKRPFFQTWQNRVQPAIRNGMQTFISISEGEIIQASNGSFQVCTLSGDVLLQEPAFSTVWGVKTMSSAVEFTSLGMSIPSGNVFHLATTAGLSGPTHVIPPFNETLHGTTVDGTVVWTCIGSGEIPAGGVPGEVHAATYFATDRGRQSLEYLAAVVRAKLLYRSRCVQIDFDCEYGRGVNLTTRQTATLHDPRIAGGLALGKIKSTVLSVGDTGIANCKVTLACAAGLGNAVTEVPGTPAFVADGYVNEGYQKHDNITIVLPTATDLGYAPPVYVANDDGISFPVTKEMVLVTDQTHVTGSQSAAIGASIQAMISYTRNYYANLQPQINMSTVVAPPPAQNMLTVADAIRMNPVWHEFQIKPINGGPFHKVYNVKFTNLMIPKDIDLQSSVIS